MNHVGESAINTTEVTDVMVAIPYDNPGKVTLALGVGDRNNWVSIDVSPSEAMDIAFSLMEKVQIVESEIR